MGNFTEDSPKAGVGPDKQEETTSVAVYQVPHHIQVEDAQKCDQKAWLVDALGQL